MESSGWSFDDDRQQHLALAGRPARVLAYAQAPQTLQQLGVPVVGYFGSQHHAESGSDAGLDLPCVGSGDGIDLDLVKSLRPDLVVGVTYAGEVYGVTPAVADQLEGLAPTSSCTTSARTHWAPIAWPTSPGGPRSPASAPARCSPGTPNHR